MKSAFASISMRAISNLKPCIHNRRRSVSVLPSRRFHVPREQAGGCSRNLQVARAGMPDGCERNLEVAATTLLVCEKFGLARFLWLIAWAATLLLSFSASVCAHQGSSSYLSVSVNGTNVTSQWDISLIDLEQVVGLDANNDGDITWGEVKAKQKEIESYAQSRLHVKVDGAVRPWRTTDLLVDHFSDGAYAVLRFAVENATPPGNLEVDYRAFFDTDALHRGLFRLEYAGKVQTAVFSPDKPRQQFVLAGASRLRQGFDF